MFNEGYDNENIISFQGPLTISLLSFLGNYLKMVIDTENLVMSRIFRIFIEVTQNISYYSAETKEVERNIKSGIGWFRLKEFKYNFELTTGNLIIKEHGPKLVSHCSEINTMSEDELRGLKRRTRSEAKIRDVGAHIGLIQTSLLSGNKLGYNITELDDKHSFFKLSVIISKNK